MHGRHFFFFPKAHLYKQTVQLYCIDLREFLVNISISTARSDASQADHPQSPALIFNQFSYASPFPNPPHHLHVLSIIQSCFIVLFSCTKYPHAHP